MSTTTPCLGTLFMMKNVLVFKSFSKSSILYIFCRMLKLGHDKHLPLPASFLLWPVTLDYSFACFSCEDCSRCSSRKLHFKNLCVCAHAAHCMYAGRQKGHRSGLELPGASYELCGGVLNQIKDFLKRSVFNYWAISTAPVFQLPKGLLLLAFIWYPLRIKK